MTPHEQFQIECNEEIERQAADRSLVAVSREWIERANVRKYSYHFTWLGRPIIQYPQDIVAMQEIVWAVQPDLIIETGIAHGGSIIFYASLLELNAICGGPPNGRVIGIDIDIRTHNREVLDLHPMRKRIDMIQGSSVAPEIVNRVKTMACRYSRVLVCLDSNHTHSHVLAELQAYAPLVSVGSYCVVFDTIIEDLPTYHFSDRPWGVGNNPMTAIKEYLSMNSDYEIDTKITQKLLVSVAPNGYLKRIR
jgi:cephalosporin hydroxylase